MAFLNRWLQFLRFLEGLLEFLDVVTTPLGMIATVGVTLYGLLAPMPQPRPPWPDRLP